MELLVMLGIVYFFLAVFVAILVGINQFIKTYQPEQYEKLKEVDRVMKKQTVHVATKYVGPLLFRAAIRYLKK